MVPLIERWRQLPRQRVCVIGDLILDRYHWSHADRVSPEAPVLVLQAERVEERLGGAASVAALLTGLDGNAMLVGVVGDDRDGQILRQRMRSQGIADSSVAVDPERPTTVKTRILSRIDQRQPHQLLRIDSEVRRPLSSNVEAPLLAAFDAIASQCDCILISDYGKGVCTPSLIQHAIGRARQLAIPLLADPAKGVDFQRYFGIPILTPNRSETAFAAKRPLRNPQDAAAVGVQLCREGDFEAIVVKLDRDGIVVCPRVGDPSFHKTSPRSVCDVTGAGDMVLAVLGLAVASGWPIQAAAQLANIAAGIEVERIGVEPISRRDVELRLTERRFADSASKILSLAEAEHICAALRGSGQRIVFTNGCYDLLHSGHVACLEEAADQGDVLFVAVNSDRSVSELKGCNRPILDEQQRLRLVAALGCVTYVLLMDDRTPHQILSKLHPDVLVKGAPYDLDNVVGSEVVTAYGGRVHVTQTIAGQSTSNIIARIQRSRN